jgi:hypothetical protein
VTFGGGGLHRVRLRSPSECELNED